jgi:two-component system, NtrC family, nitrogen regulation response regulator NtrX
MSAPAPMDPTATAPTVLVVDDERNIRRTLHMVLSGEGYRVLEASTGEEALGLLARAVAPVELCILDMKLPGMGGLEVLERMRREDAWRDLPVVVISGHATVHDAVAAIKLGATDFFEKPLARKNPSRVSACSSASATPCAPPSSPAPSRACAKSSSRASR